MSNSRRKNPAVLSLVFSGSPSAEPEWRRLRGALEVPRGWQCSWEALPDPLPQDFGSRGEVPEIILLCARSEVDYPLLVRWLVLLGLDSPGKRQRRGFPFVLADLADVGVNPEPLAPFVDGFVLGQAERVLPRLCVACSRAGKGGISRAVMMPGVYLPRAYRVQYFPSGVIRTIRSTAPFPARVSYPCALPSDWWRRHFPGLPEGRTTLRGERGTFWPLAGSERLRRLLGRPVDEGYYLEPVQDLIGRGAREFLLHFLVGLPGEEEDDRQGIIRLVKRLRHAALRFSRSSSLAFPIAVNLVCFSPRPFSPVQWEGMLPLAVQQSLMKTLVSRLQEVPRVRVIHDLPKWSYLHGILARGDRRVSELLRELARRGGDWGAALSEVNLSPDFYVVRRRSPGETLPWDHLDVGTSREELEQQARVWRRQTSSPAGSFPT